jgi:hypothetical protein
MLIVIDNGKIQALHVYNFILLKNPPFILREPRACPEFIEGTNGGAVETIGDFPFY